MQVFHYELWTINNRTDPNANWKDYRISTLHYNWPKSVHESQAFSTYTSARDCTDSEHLPANP